MTDRTRLAIENFLNACGMNEMAFEPQHCFANDAQAKESSAQFFEAYCELHRAIGREPPAWPPHLPRVQPEALL